MKRDVVEALIYGDPSQRQRLTQDFPVLPDVWIGYGENPGARLELLLTPHTRSDAATLARALRERLEDEEHATEPPAGNKRTLNISPRETRVLFNESVVYACLSFPELIRVALPLTDWWTRSIASISTPWTVSALIEFAAVHASKQSMQQEPKGTKSDPKLLRRMIALVGSIEYARSYGLDEIETGGATVSDAVVASFSALLEGLTDLQDKRGLLWSISRNRKASTSIWRSRNTVKADAAARLFAVDTRGIRWAVLDTGIDATHPAFARRDGDGKTKADLEQDDEGNYQFSSRVVRTYDFLRIKELLDPDTPINSEGTAADQMEREKLDALREDLQRNLKRGRAIDWDLIEPFLRIPHSQKTYKPPTDAHGTHVAGILAANWPEAVDTAIEAPLVGMCPQLELYDLRVLGEGGDEFTVIAALQFVRHLNAHRDLIEIHGVNLSLSVPHDVANYACGRTPVCEECERVVANGVVVVTAAGNRGFNKLAQAQGGATGDYRYISITDPGNSQNVITVGSTHRFMPHNYGVSYFSSRGPTGDGRTKPDLVAPGERIDSCSLDHEFETMDGTSMAAPHVSGAAAMLIGRNRELIGQPARVKAILCNSATDLGREPRFQGSGMVDVLRALQSM